MHTRHVRYTVCIKVETFSTSAEECVFEIQEGFERFHFTKIDRNRSPFRK